MTRRDARDHCTDPRPSLSIISPTTRLEIRIDIDQQPPACSYRHSPFHPGQGNEIDRAGRPAIGVVVKKAARAANEDSSSVVSPAAGNVLRTRRRRGQSPEFVRAQRWRLVFFFFFFQMLLLPLLSADCRDRETSSTCVCSTLVLTWRWSDGISLGSSWAVGCLCLYGPFVLG